METEPSNSRQFLARIMRAGLCLPLIASAALPVRFVYEGTVHQGLSGVMASPVAVCKLPATPHEKAAVPVPYPNAVSSSRSDLPPGKYPLKDNRGFLKISEGLERVTTSSTVSSTRPRSIATSRQRTSFVTFSYEVKIESKAVVGNSPPPQSSLFELADGSLCVVCIENQRITKILRFRRAPD